METGNIQTILGQVGAIADLDDHTKAMELKSAMVADGAKYELFLSGRDIAARVDVDLGYIIGYLPAELGTHALELFNVSHPFFGKTIPANNDDLLDIGQKFGKKWRDKKYTEEENKRRAEQLAKIGVVLPSIGEEVTSKDAKSILQALRAKDPEKAKEAEEILRQKRESRAELEKARKERLEAEAKAALAVASGAVMTAAGEEEEEEEEFYDPTGKYTTRAEMEAGMVKEKEEADEKRLRELLGDDYEAVVPEHKATLTDDSVF